MADDGSIDGLRATAVVGFIDLAGFTATTQQFASVGARGIEDLRAFINDVFAPAIEAIEAADGEVAWFAGDALAVFFDLDQVQALTAVRCLAEVVTAISERPAIESAVGPVELLAKAGLAIGPIEGHEVRSDDDGSGGAWIRRWIDGDPFHHSAAAESRAVAGQVVLHRSVGDVADLPRTVADDDGFALLPSSWPVPGPEPGPGAGGGAGSGGPGRWQPLRDRYRLPRYVAATLDAGHEVIDQHRPVTALFVALPIDRHTAASVREVEQAVTPLHGEILMLSSGDKGVVAYVVFGAPVARPERELRAVQAALQLIDNFPLARVGLASGMTYAGRLGGARRWDYAVHGDRVNLAARLMELAAPGEIVADRATTGRLDGRIEVERSRDVEVKGRTGAEPVATVVGLVAGGGAAPPADDGTAIVDRDDERQELGDRLGSPGTVAAVVGEAGVGKSRLVAAVVQDLPLPVVSAASQPHDGDRFALWRQSLPQLLDATPAEIEDRYGDDPRWPLLAPLVTGRSVPASGLTAELSVDERLRATVQIVVDALRDRAEPSVWWLEDLHHADEASHQLLRALVPHLPSLRLSLLATTRTAEAVEGWATGGALIRQLGPLATFAARSLLRERWRDRFGLEPSPVLLDELVERSGGNPLFALELVAWAATNGFSGRERSLPDEIEVPTSVVDLIYSRLDRLSLAAQPVVGFISVLGFASTRAEIVDIFATEAEAATLERGLDELVAAGVLVGTDAPTFRHGLLQEVAYERMSFELRRRLHHLILGYLERANPDPEPVAELLARHAEHGGDDGQRARYYRLAGDRARRQWAIGAAVRWYERLLPLAGQDGAAGIRVEMGRLLFAAGRWDDSRRHLEQVGPADGDEPLVQATLTRAELLVAQGLVDEAFSLLEDRFAEADQPSLQRRLLGGLAEAAMLLGDVERAEDIRDRFLALAETDDEAWSRPLDGLAGLTWLSGDLPGAVELYRSILARAEAEGDLRRAAQARSDLAGLHFALGQNEACLQELGRARQLSDQIGLIQQLAVLNINESRLRWSAGDAATAAVVALDGVEGALDLGDHRLVAHALVQLGKAEYDRGLIERAVDLAGRLGDDSALTDGRLALAEVHLAAGDLDEAGRAIAGVRPTDPDDERRLVELRDRVGRGSSSPMRGPAGYLDDARRDGLSARLDAIPELAPTASVGQRTEPE